MRSQVDRGWTRVPVVLRRLQAMQEAQEAPSVPFAGNQASSPAGSAESTPRESECRDPQERDYVHAALECYLWLPGTATVTSRHDRCCVEHLCRRGVPLEGGEGRHDGRRRPTHFPRGDPLPRVRAVSYFLPVVEELLQCPCDPDYLEYIERKLHPLADVPRPRGGAD